MIADLFILLSLAVAEPRAVNLWAARSTPLMQETVALRVEGDRIHMATNTNSICSKTREIGEFAVKDRHVKKKMDDIVRLARKLPKTTDSVVPHAWRIFVEQTEIPVHTEVWSKSLALLEQQICRVDRKPIRTVRLHVDGFDVRIQEIERGKVKTTTNTNIVEACPKVDNGALVCPTRAGIVILYHN